MNRAPLSRLRVLDLTRLLPGGLCTLTLADLGAEVTKIEQPGSGDYARGRGPFVEGALPSIGSASFRGLNRGKDSIVLDLKSALGRTRFLELVAQSDVVVESFRPGVMTRLGLSAQAMWALRPGLIICRISGWGADGPLADVAGHDINYLAEIGLLSHTGGHDDPPVIPSMQVADSASALYAVIGILSALRVVENGGPGQVVDVSIAHSALPFAAMDTARALAFGHAEPVSSGVLTGGAVCYQVYACSDGWVALGALEEKFWTTWCQAVGRPDLLPHRYDSPTSPTAAEVREIISSRSRAEWAAFADEHDCCLRVVRGLDEALAGDPIRERGMIGTIRDSELGNESALLIPVRFSESESLKTPTNALSRAPMIDEHRAAQESETRDQ